MEVSHSSIKLREDIGRPPRDEHSQLPVDLPPGAQAAKQCAASKVVSTGVQAAPTISQHSINTEAAVLVNRGMATEGAWPREVDPTDAEAVARWRKRTERDEDYIRTVVQLGQVVEGLVLENNAIDIYEEYFAGLPPPEQQFEPPSLRTLACLHEPEGTHRSVQALAWNPDGSGRLAVAYAAPPQPVRDGSSLMCCAMWDVSILVSPACVLHGPSSLTSLDHHPKDTSLLAAGHATGQISLFDVRSGPEASSVTTVDVSHRGVVTGLCWVQSKTGTEFMTAGADGVVVWWDSRLLTARLDSAMLREPQRSGTPATAPASASPPAATCLEYTTAAGPTRFMVGTAQGTILSGNRRAKAPQDRITASFAGHHGPVRSLCRHPSYPKYFLSTGDWTARLWADDVRVPLITTPYRPTYLTAAAWSPTRPALALSVGSEGRFEAWDWLQSQTNPVLDVSISDAPLTALAVAGGSRKGLCAVGCGDGSTAVVQLSAALTEQCGDERAAFASMLERECARERTLEKNAKEAKVRGRREAARMGEPVVRVTEEELRHLEDDFFSLVGAQP